ncbi:MAG: zinc ABC transporter substrate-binding protein [Bacteroidales bacterium]
MKLLFYFLLPVFIISCGRKANDQGSGIITVSIPPFKYFVEEIAGDNFKVNVMVPPGANPHIYEPSPDQINKLSRSVAYISNGYLGFESTWLDRFSEINRNMKRLSLAEVIEPIFSEHHHEGDHGEGADPHYWVSPACALKMAVSVRDLVIDLDPENRQQYEANFNSLSEKIAVVDMKAKELSLSGRKKAFMIYHPNLAYLARDYGLEEISVEYEGKEPSPLQLKELIDRARKESLKVILVQREYDTKNAKVIANETSSEIVIIDPLSENWLASTTEIINILKKSFEK